MSHPLRQKGSERMSESAGQKRFESILRERVAATIWEELQRYMPPVGLDGWACGKVADSVIQTFGTTHFLWADSEEKG